MKVMLFADDWPRGRCLILARQLSQATTLAPTECVAMAERLFAFRHKRANPAVVELIDSPLAADLLRMCHDFGISVEHVLAGGSSSEASNREG